nr:hypothetical protein [Tanacetum cinerariifolium]
MTTTLKYRDVSNDAIKLMLFPYSLEDRARIWACPHYGFSELTQIDTFCNGLTEQDQDSLNAASGGNLLNKTTREALQIIENKSKVRYSRSRTNIARVNNNSRDIVSKTDDQIDKLADQIFNLVVIVNKQVAALAKAVEKVCVTCGGAHAYYECIATDSFQNQPFSVPNNQIPPSVPNELSSYIKSNEIAIKTMQNQINVLRGDFNKQEQNLRRYLIDDMRNILSSFFQNQPLTSGTLPSNTIPNPKGEMKVVTTRSGLAYEGPSIPTKSPLEKVDEQNTEEILDKEHSNSLGSTAQIQPLVVQILISKPDVPRTQPKPLISYPSRRSFLRTGRALIDVYGEEITLRVNDESITFNLNQTVRYSSTYDDTLVNRVDVIDVTCEDFLQDVPIVKSSSLTLTPFGEKGDIHLIEKLLNADPCSLPPIDLKLAEESKEKSSVEEPPELELKDLPSHLEYAFLEDSNKLPVIIAKNLKVDEREALLNVLKSHKRAISWKISDIKAIDPRYFQIPIDPQDQEKTTFTCPYGTFAY